MPRSLQSFALPAPSFQPAVCDKKPDAPPLEPVIVVVAVAVAVGVAVGAVYVYVGAG